MKAVCMTNVLVTEMVLCNIYWAFPQLTQAGGDIKEKNTIRVKINKK